MSSIFFKSKDKKREIEFPKKEYSVNEVIYINPRLIFSNPLQTRNYYDEGELLSIADSIRRHGMITPLSIRAAESGKYELITGERRLRAARILCMEKVPCLVQVILNDTADLFPLIDNLQREDLNYFEISQTLFKLMRKYSYTKCELSEVLSISQSAVNNYLRLLDYSLPEREVLIKNNITERQARAILRLSIDKRNDCIEYITTRKLNSYQTELYIDNLFSIETSLRFHSFEEVDNYNEIIESATFDETEKVQKNNKFILKDLKLFYNSIENAVDLLKTAGIDISYSQNEDNGKIDLNIEIRKQKTKS